MVGQEEKEAKVDIVTPKFLQLNGWRNFLVVVVHLYLDRTFGQSPLGGT